MVQQPQKEARSLYHRWRSSSFAEVIAQEHVTRTLRNAVSRGKIVHAYLFCGPRGTGKTSTARILAKAVNCLNPQDGEPCNQCSSCVSVAEGRAIDLIEIDAASNRGIDDARELRDKIRFSPSESRYKVYIIDEAHMLTSEASNALLKTLEEPPEHAILILATTESHKILATISSRCQRFDFRRIPLQAIVGQLEMICREEGLSTEDGVLDRVGRMSRGSLRDAESLLDQLVAYCGNSIELDMAREILGLVGEEAVPDFADALQASDLVRGFRLIDGLTSMGADLRHFARELVDYLRALVVVKTGADTSLVQEFRADEVARLRKSSEGWEYRRLLAAIRAFGDLDGKMKQEASGQIHLEMALMEAALGGEGASAQPQGVFSQPKDRVLGAEVGAAPVRQTPGAAATARQATTTDVLPQGSHADEPKPPMASADLPAEVTAPGAIDFQTVTAGWSRVLGEVRSSGSLGVSAALQGGHVVSVSGNTVTIGFDQNPLWKTTLERPGAKDRVEAAFSGLFGTKVAVKFQYGLQVRRDSSPPDKDPVVEAAVKELGFMVTRVEPSPDSSSD